jgi:hypothetical protein
MEVFSELGFSFDRAVDLIPGLREDFEKICACKAFQASDQYSSAT